jgi:hypothetical protein
MSSGGHRCGLPVLAAMLWIGTAAIGVTALVALSLI